MPSALELADQIRAVDHELNNARSDLKSINTDIEFPHICEKRLESINEESAKLMARLDELATDKRYCESLQDKARQEELLQGVYARIDAITARRAELTELHAKALAEESALKSVKPDLKQFEKLAAQFTPGELTAMLRAALAMKVPQEAFAPAIVNEIEVVKE